MSELWTSLRPVLEGALASDTASQWARGLLILGVGLGLGRLLSRAIAALAGSVLGPQRGRIAQSLAWYVLVFIVITSTLRELGFDLSVLLGAAGVLTVALGFASQTSASNIISGLFLLAERPFEPGDVIQVDTLTGEVLSVDLLSVKLRTFDNLFVRLPNETLVKARITNLTRFPIRRIDIPLGVAYDSDLSQVRAVLVRVAEAEPLVLEEPAPAFNMLSFGDSAVQLSFNVWVMRTDFLEARARMFEAILEAFRAEGIEIPFPQRVVHQAPPTT